MTQLTETTPPPVQAIPTQPKATKTTIHNHITKESMDLSPVMQALNAFMRSTRQCAFPQLIVTCRGERRAFSRASLEGMEYKGAAGLFISRFARAEDFIEVPRGSGWLATTSRYPPDVQCLAKFCRAEGGEAGLEQADVGLLLDPSGWADNIPNVRELEIVFARQELPSVSVPATADRPS
ncbi:hypothetical protein DFH07DRAFT_309672 [Mycena maculata]|uniref:Uncharacterized protein n=1 Tax=Mycena maculata TaxID=230809 RepID=A0AAD7MJS4_9AGAR|nr:hypothetical protein DFH07DRAFT_309672 [Mycena maculata]